jgi:hypothetical protein
MKNLVLLLVALAAASCSSNPNEKYSSFYPGQEWKDTEGKVINAHGGGILYHEGVYYWYGAYMGDSTYWNPKVLNWECYRTDVIGIACYSSADLYNWKFEGIVLPAEPDDPGSDLHPSGVLERPKVIFNDKTKKFVMWVHVDSHDYLMAAAGVATSDSPTGKFGYLGSMRPNGYMCRDMTLYKDDDGRGYHIFSSNDNATLQISLLSEDYLQPSGIYTMNFVRSYREAPAIFRHDEKYYVLSSGCTGWDPNKAQYAVADSLLGEWTVKDNPCRGEDADLTFYSQSTHVLPVSGKDNAYIAMFDRWEKTDLANSRYVWLPAVFVNGELEIHWMDEWSLDVFKQR